MGVGVEWILVMILLQDYPTKISTVYKAPYATIVECDAERKVLMKTLNVKDSLAICSDVPKVEVSDG